MKTSASITVSGPEDILGYVPHSLGYWPQESLVAITLQGKRVGATLRVDLPRSLHRRDLLQYAIAVRQYLATDRKADGVVLAIYTSGEWQELPYKLGPLLLALGEELADQGLGIKDAWFIGDRYWRDALCTDTSCCPLPGRPLEDIRDSRLNAELVFLGSNVGTAPTPLLPDPSTVPVDTVEDDWFGRLVGGSGSRAQFEVVLDAWEHALLQAAPRSLDPGQQAYLRATLRIPAWRDAVLVACAAGRNAALDGAERFGIFAAAPDDVDGAITLPGLDPESTVSANAPLCSTSADSPACNGVSSEHAPYEDAASGQASRDAFPGYGEVLLGLAPRKPDWEKLDALDLVFQQLAAAGGAAGAAVMTGRGWIAWCRGRGSYAGAFLVQALESVPGYRLAELLHEMIGRGTLCGWAADPQSAWQKFGRDVS